MKELECEVLVGNMGKVFEGSLTKCKKIFQEYKQMSKDNYGRAGGESVYLIKEGEIEEEYYGIYND